jgi:hypothetical protein
MEKKKNRQRRRRRTRVAPHEVLPQELMHHIVDMLDLASVSRFECVCQAWRDVGHSSHVWQKVYRLRIASNPPHNFDTGLSYLTQR